MLSLCLIFSSHPIVYHPRLFVVCATPLPFRLVRPAVNFSIATVTASSRFLRMRGPSSGDFQFFPAISHRPTRIVRPSFASSPRTFLAYRPDLFPYIEEINDERITSPFFPSSPLPSPPPPSLLPLFPIRGRKASGRLLSDSYARPVRVQSCSQFRARTASSGSYSSSILRIPANIPLVFVLLLLLAPFLPCFSLYRRV